MTNTSSRTIVSHKFDPNGSLAVSLLSGSNKSQKREFSRLLDFLAEKPEPIELVILSNTMLSGLAESLQASLNCPIICMSQGSDRIIESLEEPYRSDARKLIRKNAKLFRLIVASSRNFAIRTTEFLALPSSHIRVVMPGVDAVGMANSEPRKRTPFTIGYMAPICKERGLDILVDAVEELTKGSTVQPELWIAGKVENERYWNDLRRRLNDSALKKRHRIFGNLSGTERRNFYAGLSAFVVSAREPESRATQLLEAMAAGVPVVGPATGIIPEVFQYANGGLLVSSDAPSWMFSQALELLASMPDTADEMGRTGSRGVVEHFSIQSTTARLASIIDEAMKEIPDIT